jgi:hypothetical protein
LHPLVCLEGFVLVVLEEGSDEAVAP